MLVKDNISSSLLEDIKDISDEYISKIKNSTFMITGATGFIAYYVVLSLLYNNDFNNSNNRIVLLFRNMDKAKKKYKELLYRDDIVILNQDVCDSINCIPCDYIIHLASSADSVSFEKNPIGVYNSNTIGTNNLLNFASTCKNLKSFIYISSFMVYGSLANRLSILNENDVLGAADWLSDNSCYVYGKRGGELLCRCYYNQKNIPVRIVRPGFIYGASGRNDKRIYSDIINTILDEKDIILKSDGNIFRSLCYVTDLVRGIFSVVLFGENSNAYNVASEFISIRQYAEIASSISEKSKLIFENKNYISVPVPKELFGQMSINKVKNDCKFKPKVDVRKGISMSIDILTFEEKNN